MKRARMTATRQAKRKGRHRRTPWTHEAIDVLRRLYAHTSTAEVARVLGFRVRPVYAKANTLGLNKSAAFLASERSGRLGKGTTKGKPTWFAKGHVPHNKGKAMAPEVKAKCAATMFKPGNRPTTWMPVGSTRINADGYLEMKVADTGYPPHDWKGVHRLRWEEAHGPIPAGMIVVFRNGNKADLDLANLELVTRAQLMSRNTIANYPPALRGVVKLIAKTRRAIHEREQQVH